jgi:hypothetical protein
MSSRLPYKVKYLASATKDNLGSSSKPYLFTDGTNSYCSYTPDQKIWYDNWKDQLFYAVASTFQPGTLLGDIGNCPTCLRINGSGDYAAVIIFAGDKLTNAAGQLTQPRNTASDRGTIGNYLDGLINPGSITANTGGGNYQAAAASSTFNDIVYAIDTNLKVHCSNAQGVMKSVPDAAVAPPGSPTALKDYAAC